ncbi:hypothetical protein WME89_31010 [Sorangium sp. So ce321]|uniref:hypothetical protein n=1 Tax=Sorangium sp. So ce321 TaxID=3133300 RepID=UPI003F60F76E
MPTLEHNALVEMFREHPELAPRLLATLLHVEVPPHAAVAVVESSLDQPEAQIVIDRVERALSAGDPARWVAALFRDANWRPHLVGAIALLLDQSETLDRNLLWCAIDAGSWVTPQLIVTAVFVDPSFPEKARVRVDEQCPVLVPVGLTPAERHSATGPDGLLGRNAKMLASLLAASASIPSLERWASDLQRDVRIEQLLKEDAWNKSDEIVASWMTNVRRAFLERGRILAPKTT